MQKTILTFLSVFSLCIVNLVNAQELQLSEESRISLITILPGNSPEELFGHSAIRISDPHSNIDISFNYGTFQFDSFFLTKFLYGELDYFLSDTRFSLTVEQYLERRRPMIEQQLNLSTVQKQELFEFLQLNALPENRYYRYDFLYDNCSTRIRDVFESVLEEDLQFTFVPSSRPTFREMINSYVDHRPFYNLSINLLLGNKIDRMATLRESMFLPDFLMERFDQATIRINGETQPLVSTKNKLLQIEDYERKAGFPWALLSTWTIFLIGLAITYKNIRDEQPIEPWFDLPFFTIIGLAGLLICFLWFISLHHVTANNLNLLWAWPTHLLIMPLLYRSSISGNKIALYFMVMAFCSTVIVIGWSLWPQELHSAIIPLLLLLAIRSGWIAFNKIVDSEPNEPINGGRSRGFA